nr:hypothetical protein [uncultured Nitrososphaera sp.]
MTQKQVVNVENIQEPQPMFEVLQSVTAVTDKNLKLPVNAQLIKTVTGMGTVSYTLVHYNTNVLFVVNGQVKVFAPCSNTTSRAINTVLSYLGLGKMSDYARAATIKLSRDVWKNAGKIAYVKAEVAA